MYCNSGGCIHPGRSLVGRAGFMIMIPISSLIILSLTCSRSLIFKRHGRKIRVTSKICFRHVKELPPTSLLCTQTKHNNSPTLPTHTTLIMMYCTTTLGSTTRVYHSIACHSLSRVERHGLQIAISQQIAIANTQEAS